VKQHLWLGLALAVVGSGSVSSARADSSLSFSLDEVDAPAAAAHKEAAPPSSGTAVSDALGGLRWNMNKADLLAMLKARIQAEFQERVKAERDIVRQDALYQEAKDRYLRIKDAFVVFDARKSGWDVSPIADEFRRGTDESMLVIDDKAARDYYFFIRGKLWKWYRELKPEANGGDFAQVAEIMRGQFGGTRGRELKRGEGAAALAGVSWSDPSTRVTVMQRGAETCIVFEARATLEQLAVLRKDAVSTQQKRGNSALDAVLLSDGQREAWKREDPNASAAPQQQHTTSHNRLE
jgi:hypothetical protein